MNQTNEDYFIFNSDCSVTTEYINKNNIKSKLLPFTLKKIIDQGAYYKDGIINIISEKNKISMSIENFKLKGKHNIRNAMAAATVANLLQIRKETIRKSLEHFQGVETLEVGMRFQASTEQGPVPVVVTKVADDVVTVDGNRPLAGQTLNFSVKVEEVREATAEELEHGHIHTEQSGGCCGGGDGKNSEGGSCVCS